MGHHTRTTQIEQSARKSMDALIVAHGGVGKWGMQSAVARALGRINTVHVYRYINHDYLSPTLSKALLEHGYVVRPPGRKRITVNGVDPESAADSLINLGGEEYAHRVAMALIKGVHGGAINHISIGFEPSPKTAAEYEKYLRYTGSVRGGDHDIHK